MKCYHFTILLCLLAIGGCAQKEHKDIFAYDNPVDLTEFMQLYDWYQEHENKNRDSVLLATFTADMPEDEFYLFTDTSFVLRVPEYANSKQPFLHTAEEFYNSCAFTWNLLSNYEIWYRGHTADLLREDDAVKWSIRTISVDIIRNAEIRKAAQNYKDSLLLFMAHEPDEWQGDVSPMDVVMSFGNVIEKNSYKFYEDEDSFVNALDSVMDFAENLAKDKFQKYLDADEDHQLQVILGELATCQTFDEQCSLWRNWANCEKSSIDDEWIVAIGGELMKSGNYSPLLSRIWITWRALCQTYHYGMSRDSAIPNHYYNEFRKRCYLTCLRRIEKHPDDVFAMNCAASIGGRTNMNRFGQNYFGNEAMIEKAEMLPNRYRSMSDDDEEEE